MKNFEKLLRNMEKKTPVKKLGKMEGERTTKLDPYKKLPKIDVRDLDMYIEDEEEDTEND